MIGLIETFLIWFGYLVGAVTLALIVAAVVFAAGFAAACYSLDRSEEEVRRYGK